MKCLQKLHLYLDEIVKYGCYSPPWGGARGLHFYFFMRFYVHFKTQLFFFKIDVHFWRTTCLAKANLARQKTLLFDYVIESSDLPMAFSCKNLLFLNLFAIASVKVDDQLSPCILRSLLLQIHLQFFFR